MVRAECEGRCKYRVTLHSIIIMVHLVPSASTFHSNSFITECAVGRATEGEETTHHSLEMPAIILNQATPTINSKTPILGLHTLPV